MFTKFIQPVKHFQLPKISIIFLSKYKKVPSTKKQIPNNNGYLNPKKAFLSFCYLEFEIWNFLNY